MAAPREIFAKIKLHEPQLLCDETELLQFICDSSVNSALRVQIAERLAGYTWRARDNLILFEAIHELLARNSQKILEHLPAELTRRGFPDISCDALFAPSSLSAKAALALAEKLLLASQ